MIRTYISLEDGEEAHIDISSTIEHTSLVYGMDILKYIKNIQWDENVFR